jgi:two-component system OmpR family response regulator
MAISGVYPRFDRTTILFADANADTRFAYESVAVAEDFGVLVAGDGHEALALAQMFLPAVLVLETRLPGLGGFELIRRLRADPSTSAMVIVIVSDQDGEDFDALVRASECDARLTKPCTMSGLFRLVQVLLLGRRRAAAG